MDWLAKPELNSNTEKIWKINEDQSIRFVKSVKAGVKAVVFKVRSLEEAGRYLKEKNY